MYSNNNSFRFSLDDLYLSFDSSSLPFTWLIFDFNFSVAYFSSSTSTLSLASVEVMLSISSIILFKRCFGFCPLVIKLNSVSFSTLSFWLLSFSLFKLDIFLSNSIKVFLFWFKLESISSFLSFSEEFSSSICSTILEFLFISSTFDFKSSIFKLELKYKYSVFIESYCLVIFSTFSLIAFRFSVLFKISLLNSISSFSFLFLLFSNSLISSSSLLYF